MADNYDQSDVDRLVGRLRFEFPAVPEELIRDAMVEAAREVAACGLLQQTFDLTRLLRGGQADYDFSHLLPEGYTVDAIQSVELCGCCIDCVDPKCNPCACGYEICGFCAITLHPCPSDAPGQTLTVCASLTPETTTCEVPPLLVGRYTEVMKNLTRWGLLSVPNLDSTNLSAATRYRDMGRSTLRREAEKIMPKGTPSNSVPIATGSCWL